MIRPTAIVSTLPQIAKSVIAKMETLYAWPRFAFQAILAPRVPHQSVNPCRLPALKIRFQRWPVSDSLTGKDAPAGFRESWDGPVKRTAYGATMPSQSESMECDWRFQNENEFAVCHGNNRII
jgi:hypothetical protein